MLTLIIGGAASKKSEYAEGLAAASGAKSLFYLATMKPDGAQAEERIEKHRKMRAGKGFITVECLTDIEKAGITGSFDESAILLEDLGNLLANELFDVGGSDDEITERILKGMASLGRKAKNVFVVADDIFSDTGDYDEDTLRYIRLLGNITLLTAESADIVTRVVFGIPVPLKE